MSTRSVSLFMSESSKRRVEFTHILCIDPWRGEFTFSERRRVAGQAGGEHPEIRLDICSGVRPGSHRRVPADGPLDV